VPELTALLDRYRPEGDAETADIQRVRTLVEAAADPYRRELLLHVTASALIVHPPTARVLLRWHQRQQAWLQVGGHGDPGETDPLAIVAREAEEETGLADLVPWPDGEIRHVVIVSVPPGKGEPAHEHADVRFFMATGTPDAIRPENAHAPLRWLSLPAARDTTSEPNLRETLTRIEPLLHSRLLPLYRHRLIIGAMVSIRLADRMARLGTESAFEVLARARAIEDAGRKVIHLEIGEPDFPTAPHIVEAAVEALRAGATHYVPAPGIPPLRQAVAAFLERTGRMRVTPDRVVVTPGAKPIMFFTILAMAGEGDEVLYPDPGFPMYESIVSFAGAVPVPVPLRERNGFRIDTGELERLITDRSRLLIINSPHNPCGSALTREDCEAIAAIALRHDLTVLTDEVYWAIRYGPGPGHASVLDVDGMPDRTILLDGWSKTFAMTGWRLGFGVFPPALVEPITRLAINSVSCTSAFSQYAAIAALEGPWDPVDQMVAEFRRRRDIVVAGLNEIPGITCLEPQGAFYAFPDITGTGQTSADLQARLLTEAGVAALSGPSFGRYGEGFLRLSYANSVENIRFALEAIRAQLT